MRVVVVGAGFAGLAAAEALASRGLEVIVLEARDRVGGRVWSRELPSGDVVEMGAEFILPGNDVIRATAARLGLALFDKGTTYGDREPRGGPPVSRDALMAGYRRLAETARGGGLAGTSVREALDSLGLEPGVREAIRSRVEISTAYPADDQDASVLVEAGTTVGDFATYSTAGGNQRIALELARRLPSAVRLRAPVVAITWQGGPRPAVVVRTEADEIAADRVVVAVPASVMDRIAFEPSLPPVKARALAAVRYGQAAKLFLPMLRPAPPSATMSVPDRFWTFTQHGPAGTPLQTVGSFAGSPIAMARLQPEHGPERWVGAVQRLRPDLAVVAGDPVLSTWQDDPWIRGAYSARSRTSPMDDAALAEPVGPIHFAGEHTAGENHATMHGALASGLRAAAEIAATDLAAADTLATRST